MGLLNLFKPKMRRFERDGRWVEVGRLRRVLCDGQPCYEIDGRGDVDFFLTGSPSAELLYIEERPDGWTIGYAPTDDDFASFASELIAMGEWH